MLDNFTHDPSFSNWLQQINNNQEIKRQLKDIIESGHKLGLDWYFTNNKNLRCGRKEITVARASRVCFVISLTGRGQVRIPRGQAAENAYLPLEQEYLTALQDLMNNFGKNNTAHRPGGGFLPNDYVRFDAGVQFDGHVLNSFNDPVEARQRRLLVAKRSPSRHQMTITVYDRNPDVVAEVLCQAEGKCQRCGKDAPFARQSNGQPYLEVHHKIPLSEQGEDTVENAIALCPNCHREMHHGSPRDRIL